MFNSLLNSIFDVRLFETYDVPFKAPHIGEINVTINKVNYSIFIEHVIRW
jgi:hypothetical protein